MGIIKKYLKNIEAQLEGKNVRKIRLNKDNLMVVEVVKKEIKTKKTSDGKSKIHKIMSFIIKHVIRCIIIYIL